MVKIHFKRGDESQFLYETTVDAKIDDLILDVSTIYNGRLKVSRICDEMQMLAKHGVTLPPNMQGLTDEQIMELKLSDEWGAKCVPSGGYLFKKDDIGRRNGKAPNEKMAELLTKTSNEAKDLISHKNVDQNVLVGSREVSNAVDMLRGATMIVYPMGLPPHEPIKMEFDDEEDLAGTQASRDIIPGSELSIWWAGKELLKGKLLKDIVGSNEKTKIVAKMQKRGSGPPGREPVVSEADKKRMMADAYRRQEELKKLDDDSDNSYLGASWADNNSLKRQFQGLSNISWR